jgi:hypothetical protein
VKFEERAKAEGEPRLSQEEESMLLSFFTISTWVKFVKDLADPSLHLSNRATVLNLSDPRGRFQTATMLIFLDSLNWMLIVPLTLSKRWLPGRKEEDRKRAPNSPL